MTFVGTPTLIPGDTRALVKFPADLVLHFIIIVSVIIIIITILLQRSVAMFNCLVNSMLGEHNITILGVNLLTNSLTSRFELGDIGEVTNVDGAVSTTGENIELTNIYNGLS